MSRSPATRSRPRSHQGDAPVELSIFEATEVLLKTEPLHELSVAQIIEGANISRASFYHYFGSKFDVLVALTSRIFDQMYDETHTRLEAPWEGSGEALRTTLGAALGMWEAHRDVINATLENMHAVEGLHEVWLALRGRFADILTAQIEQEREAGRAPVGLPSAGVATICVIAAERIFYVGTAGLDTNLATNDQRLDAIVAVALSAIYGHPAGREEAA